MCSIAVMPELATVINVQWNLGDSDERLAQSV